MITHLLSWRKNIFKNNFVFEIFLPDNYPEK